MNELKKLGDRIKYYRKLKLYTQQELAEKADLSLQHIGCIERGESNPTFSTLIKISEALNVKIKKLFEYEEVYELSIEQKKAILIEFIQYAKKPYLDMLYTMYKGLL